MSIRPSDCRGFCDLRHVDTRSEGDVEAIIGRIVAALSLVHIQRCAVERERAKVRLVGVAENFQILQIWKIDILKVVLEMSGLHTYVFGCKMLLLTDLSRFSLGQGELSSTGGALVVEVEVVDVDVVGLVDVHNRFSVVQVKLPCGARVSR